MEVRVSLPDGATQKDLLQFLEYLKSKGEEVDPVSLKKMPKHHCLNCLYREQGECSMFSVTCATKVFNREEPSYWSPRNP